MEKKLQKAWENTYACGQMQKEIYALKCLGGLGKNK